MAHQAYSEINLHCTWHVQDNSPVLRDEIEQQLHRFLLGKAGQTAGVVVRGVGGTDDHVHVVVSVRPSLLISDWIGKLKGSSSHFINHRIANHKVLGWQGGYGVVSFGTRDLPWVLEYVRNQREHHANGTTHDRLERVESADEE